MFQRKEQDKAPEELSEEETGNLPNRVQSNNQRNWGKIG